MGSAEPFDVAEVCGDIGLDFLVEKVDKLVSLPDVHYRLEALIVDPSSTTDSIAGLLESDPDLCARMLRMANSAFYSFPTRIETIARAISAIGLRQIRELVLVTTIVKAFEGIPEGKVDMTSFWEHSVAVGVMAREIGRQARTPNAEGLYIPGLLHDLGRLVMYLELPILMHELIVQRASSGQPMFHLEHESLGYSHADIGGRLLEFWKLPQSIWEPVVTHHNPGKGGEYAFSACVVHIADAWVNSNHFGNSSDGFDIAIDSEALQLVGLDHDKIELAGQVASEQTHTIVRQFMSH